MWCLWLPHAVTLAEFPRRRRSPALPVWVPSAELHDHARFTVKFLKNHTECRSFAAPAAPKHDRPRQLDREQLYRAVRDALFNSGHGLTPREAEVCASIVLGCTVLGTGQNLNISAHTVATHRKRAYSKLGISSQNELFACYFDALRSVHQPHEPRSS